MSHPSPPKKWKFALLVWCFIYPAITFLSVTIVPLLSDFPGPLRTLVLSLILVPVMAFFYIPFINRRFFNWLRK
jgi:antibiotic biosynthesis monooxygenase (ABM) superfamily enzyme